MLALRHNKNIFLSLQERALNLDLGFIFLLNHDIFTHFSPLVLLDFSLENFLLPLSSQNLSFPWKADWLILV